VGFGNNGLAKANLHGANDQKVLAGGDRESVGAGFTDSGVRKSGILSRHRHSGDVQALVIKGKWYYLEHDWIAEEGSFAYEPPGETHTLYVPTEVSEMITLFTVKGGYTYVDPKGRAIGYEDVFTKIEAALEHYSNENIDENLLKKIIR
jgi:quercetin dioxygenase-like cupin family protein